MRYFLIALTLALAPSSAYAKKAPPPEPSEHPDWARTAEAGVAALQQTLIDPGSAQIEWVSGFRWGYSKPLIGRRTHGWVACGNVNAKNRMGGYVGEQGFTLFVDPEGNIKVGMISDLVSSCIDGEHVPVNPELLAARPNMPANSVAAAPSIADELKKLAELRDLGVLTPEEFEKQKAKLLNE